MSPGEVNGALGVVGTVGVLGLFLPGIDDAWSDDPHDSSAVRRLRFGESVYLGSAAVLTMLAAYAQGTPAPFVLGFGLALVIVAAHEYAIRQRGAKGQSA